MFLFVLGINHRSAPVEVREKLAVSSQQIPEFLVRGVTLPHVKEMVLVSTCNRVEVYIATGHLQQARDEIIKFLAEFQSIDLSILEKHSYFYEGFAAVQHGFRVGSSLDSMIIGEPQILGQVKDAYSQASELGTTGRLLNKFFHKVFNVAKKVRTETNIASQPVSVSFAAATLAKQIFNDLSGKKTMVLGAGKMSELAIRHLKAAGVSTFFICNRSPKRAEELAEMVGGEAIPFEGFYKWLEDADIVLASTAAPNYLFGAKEVQAAMKVRKNSPMFFIDIAVPRNIAPDVNKLPNVYLYDIDDLSSVVEANKEEREREAVRAESIIKTQAEEFLKVLKSFAVVPTISSLSKKFDDICRLEVNKIFQKMPDLTEDQRQLVEAMASAIVNKILHDPMVALKEETPAEHQVDYSALVRKLFHLDEA